MPWRRLWQLGAFVAGVLLLAVGAAAVPGSIAVRDRPGGTHGWLARCARHQPRPDRLLLHRCSRVTGRVVAVRHSGAGATRETHLLVAARLHLFVIKLEHGARRPGVGAFATFEGALLRARNGMREVDAFRSAT